ncbi:hypothetical protein P167DRAFT_341791 [Morchella conica CCBAS932]|uniref:Uncharacterized protein n=1 Tax=Morchella conica CCBAS932 TaxID=1392247 RepID=A0A3N4KDD8_9PEZI|nr:hypothetical protein P167DRAFT_341791 [Morchella conica CCBAS932]
MKGLNYAIASGSMCYSSTFPFTSYSSFCAPSHFFFFFRRLKEWYVVRLKGRNKETKKERHFSLAEKQVSIRYMLRHKK